MALLALSSLVLLTHAAVPLTTQKTFGHSVKNGPLPANTEVTTFEHNCSLPPCVITQIHVPSIYPGGGESWNWTHGILNIYIDGDQTPTITMTLLELAGESRFNSASGGHDGGPWGINMMGRTAHSGGVYSTVRIPFGTSIKTTIQAAPSAKAQGVYWMIVRGLESHPVVLGDLTLPPTARLKIYRVDPTELENFQLVTLANVSSAKSGALLRVNFDAIGPNFGYLEACMRLVTDGATTPLFLSSGAEDYFLSASYFDEGMFKTPNSGLSFFQPGNLGAYKTHDVDPVLFHNGMQLIFRRCEQTQGCGSMAYCPNQYCPPGSNASADVSFKSYDFNQHQLDADVERRALENNHDVDVVMSSSSSVGVGDTNYSEYFLGPVGQTCTVACAVNKLKCNPQMDLGNITEMMVHLGISDCWKNGTSGGKHEGMQWFAPDQPGYIPLPVDNQTHGKEPNYRECMGFVGYPPISNCEASYPTNARVCHCTATIPPPPPPPPPVPVTYNTVVWLYEWDAADVHEGGQQGRNEKTSALTVISNLVHSNLITQAEEDALVDRILGTHDEGLLALLNGFANVDHHVRLVKHLRRIAATSPTTTTV
eukprot:m.112903 g.112903  ORF g.112903 m.112903 type:complete len:595 (+) comp28226_c0_seq2:35-1819(+)